MSEKIKIGAMGKPTPLYDIDIVDPDGKPVADGETGEIVIKTDEKVPCGLYMGYYRNEEATKESYNNNIYHTGDLAWRDEDGFYFYVGRNCIYQFYVFQYFRELHIKCIYLSVNVIVEPFTIFCPFIID